VEYRTILVHADASVHAPARIRLAALLAQRTGAHLVGAAATCISRHACPEGYTGAPGKLIAGYLDPLHAAANRALDQFDKLAHAAGATTTVRRLVSDLPDDALARQAAFADLVVLSQDDPRESTSDVVVNLPEYVVLNCARPVLVVPHSRLFDGAGQRVLVAWNGSREAAAAAHGALPLLYGAQQVTVAICEPPPQDSAQGVDPPAELVAWFGRHGVRAEVRILREVADAGAALLALCEVMQADLMVMGCYGQPRLRELLLGGASRAVLRDMTVPVLMAH
jgi:nucleotide-binding universal stress UspA family protein